MSRELKVHHDALTPEVAWLAKMTTGPAPASALIRVTALLGALVLRRTDLEMFQESVLPVEGAAQATILVEAENLRTALKSVSGPLVLTVNDDELIVKSKTSTARIKAAVVEYPIWPEFEPTAEKVAIGGPQLARVLTSAGTDDAVPQLMAVAFDAGSMVTTDRFRLSRSTYGPSEFKAMAPSAALKAMAKRDGVVYVDPGLVNGANWIELSSGGRTVLAPMPEQELFKWKHLVPADPSVRVALRKSDLLAAAGGDEVTITVSSDSVAVVSHSEGIEVERTIEPVQMIEHRQDLSVRLRSKYLTEALRGISSGLVLLEGDSINKPVVLQDIGEIDLHLIMPVRQKAS